MNLVVLFNLLTIILLFSSIIILVRKRKKSNLSYFPFTFISIAFSLLILVCITNFLEHSGITPYFDLFENYFKLLFIPFLVFALYSYWIHDELDKRKKVEDFLNQVILTSPVIIFVHDLKTDKVKFLNRKLNIEYLYTDIEDEKDFSDIKPLIHPENSEEIEKYVGMIRSNMDPDKVFQIDFRMKSGKDEYIFLHTYETVFEVDHDKKPVKLLGISVDITEKKKIERELKKHKEHLETLVNNRTDALNDANEELQATIEELYQQREELQTTLERLYQTQEQLIQAEKMASIGVLTTGIAHEINNPLNFIKSGLYSLEKILDHPDRIMGKDKSLSKEKVMEYMQQGISRISDIVRSLNQFNRAAPQKSGICNLRMVITNCLKILSYELKEKAEVHTDYCTEDIFVTGNEGKYHQMFLNLISNAYQSIEERGEITIQTRLSENREKVHIQIRDNGSGISKENLNKIFDPFFTTKEAGKGTGMGLSIVYGIVSDFHGKIHIESEPGVGSTVFLEFPVDPAKKHK